MPWIDGKFVRRHTADDGRDTLHGPNAWASAKARQYKIASHDMDARSNDLAGGINNTLNKNGENAPIANIDMGGNKHTGVGVGENCLLYTSPSPRDRQKSRMPSSA